MEDYISTFSDSGHGSISRYLEKTGWWWLAWNGLNDFFLETVGNGTTIPIDELMFFREVGQPPTSMCTIVSPSKSNTIKLTLNRIGILQLFWRPHCDVTIDCGSVRVHNPQMALCYLRRKNTVFISIPPNPCLIQYPLYTIKYLLSETTENPIIFHRNVPYFLDTAGSIQHRQARRWRWVGTGDAGGGWREGRERPERVHPEGAGAMICDEETGVSERYPLVICYIAIENGPVEIVDLPIKHI